MFNHWRLKLTDKITFSTLFHFLGGLIDRSTGTRLRIQPTIGMEAMREIICSFNLIPSSCRILYT